MPHPHRTISLLTVLLLSIGFSPTRQALAIDSCDAACPVSENPYPIVDLRSLPEGTATGFVHAEGRHLIGPDGKPFRMKGFNLPDWLQVEGWLLGNYVHDLGGTGHENDVRDYLEAIAPGYGQFFFSGLRDHFYRKSDLALLARMGANTFRIPIAHWMLKEPYGGLEYLDKMVGWADELGVYLVLSLHSAPGCQNGLTYCDPTLEHEEAPLFDFEGYQQELVSLWTKLAARYADEPAVAAYNLLNEPNNYPHTQVEREEVLQVYEDVIRAVREVDKNHLILLDGDEFGMTLELFRPELVPPSAIPDNIAISFHSYYFSGCNSVDTLWRDLKTQMKADNLRQHFDAVLAAVQDQDLPVIVGEYGAHCIAAQQAYHQVLAEKGLIHALYYAPFGYGDPESHSLILCNFDAPNWASFIDSLSIGALPRDGLADAAFKDLSSKAEMAAATDRACDLRRFFAD